MDINEVKNLVRQHVVLKQKVDDLSTLQSTVKQSLTESLQELGVADDKGHLIIELGEDVEGIARIQRQRRVSKSLDIEVAEDLLKAKGLHEKCIKMIPVLDEDEIMSAFYDGLITEEDIDTMFPAKITWALVMK